MHVRKQACRPEYDILFDIGATSIAVGIVHHSKEGGELLWHARTGFSLQVYDDFERYKRTMLATLLDLGMRLMSEGVRAPDVTRAGFRSDRAGVSCVLSAPWYTSVVRDVSETKEKPFQVSQSLYEKLQTRAVEVCADIPEVASWKDVVGPYEHFESFCAHTRMEGYPVEQWNHRQTREFSITSVYTLVSVDVHARVRDVLERVLPNHDARIVSSLYLTSRLFTKEAWGGEGAHTTFIEVLGQITHIATIRRGTIVATRTIPIGTNDLLRALSPAAKSFEEAHGTLHTTLKGCTDKELCELPAELTSAVEGWHEAVRQEQCLQAHGVTPPDHIVLLVGMNWYPLLVPILRTPWQVPGIRTVRSMVVTPCTDFVWARHEGADVPKKALTDSRLQVFTHALSFCCAS